MRTINIESGTAALQAAIAHEVRADYVYMYPPRQAYRASNMSVLADRFQQDLARVSPINLYVHVPFCSQICAYCNLFAVAGRQDHDYYTDLLRAEFDRHAPQISNRSVETLYIGGGTPSLLRGDLLALITGHISQSLSAPLSGIPEVALEVAPETVTNDSIDGFLRAGIRRINLGVQSFDREELHGIGRRSEPGLHRAALALAVSAGFDNVCVDLIYGLPGQSDATWSSSIAGVIDVRPQTVCCYALTLRPKTGYAAKGFTETDDRNQYYKYDLAHAALTEAGYVQETHVRWILPGFGGYKQKSNHWAGQDILGIGAGARSYMHSVDLRNGYSVRHRRSALAAYERRITQGEPAWTDGFLMDGDERARKMVILGLGNLNRALFFKQFGIDPVEYFPAEFESLATEGLVDASDESFRLTEKGQRHRDVAVQLFFSDRVRQLVSDHNYDE